MFEEVEGSLAGNPNNELATSFRLAPKQSAKRCNADFSRF